MKFSILNILGSMRRLNYRAKMEYLKSKKETLLNNILLLLLIFSLAVSYFILKQNQELQYQLAVAKNEVEPGYRLLPYKIYKSSNDSLITINPSTNKTILYFFSVKCKVCIENQKYLEYLIKKYKNIYNFYLISIDDKDKLKTFVNKSHYKFEYYYIREQLTDRKVFRVPLVLVLLIILLRTSGSA